MKRLLLATFAALILAAPILILVAPIAAQQQADPVNPPWLAKINEAVQQQQAVTLTAEETAALFNTILVMDQARPVEIDTSATRIYVLAANGGVLLSAPLPEPEPHDHQMVVPSMPEPDER